MSRSASFSARSASRSLRVAAAVVCAVQLPACFLFDDDTGADFGLSVVSSRQSITAINERRPRDGELYILVDLEMDNRTEGSVALLPTEFKIRSLEGVEYRGSALSELVDGGCASDTSIGPGGHARCVVVFEAPSQVSTVSVSLAWSAGSAESALATEACGLCDGQCFDFDTDAVHCGYCNRPVGWGTCVDGEPECDEGMDLCGSFCVDLRSSRENCGACDNVIAAEMGCLDGTPTCLYGKTDCGEGCVDLRSHVDDCGSCGRACPGGPAECVDGACDSRVSTVEQVACDSVCNAHGLVCYGATATYGAGANVYPLELGCSEIAPARHPLHSWADLAGLDCSCWG